MDRIIVSADRMTATLDATGQHDAAAMDGLIARLIRARSHMVPRLDEIEPGEINGVVSNDPRWFVQPAPHMDGVLISLLHPGAGWVHFRIPEEHVAQLALLLLGASHRVSPDIPY